MDSRPSSCAMCVIGEAQIPVRRKAREVWLCTKCYRRLDAEEDRSGCLVGEKIIKGGLKGQVLSWEHVATIGASSLSNLIGEGVVKPKPTLDQYDNWSAYNKKGARQ